MRFTVYGTPQGKGRPRFARRGAYIHTYTPKETADYEKQIADAFKQTEQDMFCEPIRVFVKAFYKIPKSTSKVRREMMLKGFIRPVVKPDIDNVCKAVLDALNGVAYHDDNQVVIIYGKKLYGEEPRIEVTIRSVAKGAV